MAAEGGYPGGCVGDTNHDGAVDFVDLNAVLASFGQHGDLPGDVNGDLVVNFYDLNLLLARSVKRATDRLRGTLGACPCAVNNRRN